MQGKNPPSSPSCGLGQQLQNGRELFQNSSKCLLHVRDNERLVKCVRVMGDPSSVGLGE
ncbi:hypothetical protein JHK84_055921 [Glycine max]|nr:hypothetical protein JHK85_056901 [Glycine max]KAG5074690.1 hypothetical protein JHK84_055921 [Glycine max]KHN11516.1 hypothetical protein glysoja_015411 [Glycine soja]